MRTATIPVLFVLVSCARQPAPTPAPVAAIATVAPPTEVASAPPPPVEPLAPPEPTPEPTVEPTGEVVQLAVPKDLPIYPVHGGKTHRNKAVMLAGMCSNPAWYLNTFPDAAVAYGDFVGLQGDVACGGVSTKWSSNSPLIERRMARAFDEAGMGDLQDVTVVGYSQGAERAEWLAAYDPVRFTRFVLIGGPIVPSPERFAHAHAVVLMAGSNDLQTLMRDGADRLRKAGIPATFMVLPGARHGEMGPAAQEMMGRALDWLEENDKPKKSTVARVTWEPAATIAQ
jgi:pimeloyl-ACP methyl ester carboxylesterase